MLLEEECYGFMRGEQRVDLVLLNDPDSDIRIILPGDVERRQDRQTAQKT